MVYEGTPMNPFWARIHRCDFRIMNPGRNPPQNTQPSLRINQILAIIKLYNYVYFENSLFVFLQCIRLDLLCRNLSTTSNTVPICFVSIYLIAFESNENAF